MKELTNTVRDLRNAHFLVAWLLFVLGVDPETQAIENGEGGHILLSVVFGILTALYVCS